MKPPLIILVILLIAVALTFAVRIGPPAATDKLPASGDHLYATWDTMEFDKSVAAWLILRFIDQDAQFVFHSQGSEVSEGIPFDVPGADWSRKHRKCTSDCLLEVIETDDPKVLRIVEIAHRIELNAWHLDDFPRARRCLEDFREIADRNTDPSACLEETLAYIDNLYSTIDTRH